MSFQSEVMKAISKEFPGLFAHRKPQYATTSTGQQCAVYINQGLTCTDVILYYWENETLEKKVERFFFVVKATAFAAQLLNLIPQESNADPAWQTAIELVVEGAQLYVERTKTKPKNVMYNYN